MNSIRSFFGLKNKQAKVAPKPETKKRKTTITELKQLKQLPEFNIMPKREFKPFPVIYFQLQVASEFHDQVDPTKFLRDIDPRCPIVQALEGGNGKGPLYQCILDKTKRAEMLEKTKDNKMIYINGRKFEEYQLGIHDGEVHVDDYRPDYYVHWNFGDDPSLSPEK